MGGAVGCNASRSRSRKGVLVAALFLTVVDVGADGSASANLRRLCGSVVGDEAPCLGIAPLHTASHATKGSTHSGCWQHLLLKRRQAPLVDGLLHRGGGRSRNAALSGTNEHRTQETLRLHHGLGGHTARDGRANDGASHLPGLHLTARLSLLQLLVNPVANARPATGTNGSAHRSANEEPAKTAHKATAGFKQGATRLAEEVGILRLSGLLHLLLPLALTRHQLLCLLLGGLPVGLHLKGAFAGVDSKNGHRVILPPHPVSCDQQQPYSTEEDGPPWPQRASNGRTGPC